MADERDPYPEFDDLMGVDLDQLDLDDIDLDDEPQGPRPWMRWVAFAGIAGLGFLVMWVPQTDYYMLHGSSNWMFAALCVAATIVGVLGGRWLLRWADASAKRWAARRKKTPDEPAKPPSPWVRALTLVAALAGMGVLIFAVSPADTTGGGGGGYSNLWFLVAFGAVGVGLLLGRWLLMQEHNPFKKRGPVKPIKLPPWFKWVSLTVLVGGGAVVLLGMQLFSSNNQETLEFSLGGAGFVIGVLAAIWVARRFDELERKGSSKTNQSGT